MTVETVTYQGWVCRMTIKDQAIKNASTAHVEANAEENARRKRPSMAAP